MTVWGLRIHLNPKIGVLHLMVTAHPAEPLCQGSWSLELCFQKAVGVRIAGPEWVGDRVLSSPLLAPSVHGDIQRVWLETAQPAGRHDQAAALLGGGNVKQDASFLQASEGKQALQLM